MLDFLKPQTLCKDCKFHRHIVRNPSAPQVWYNHFCGASELPESIDPVTGETGFAAVNDFGNQYFSDVQFRYCRDVNTDGNCPLFTEKTA
ncbi:MAG TPA: hypothetical protein VIY48_13625 [Candidatus Paceibacterota bacterium]